MQIKNVFGIVLCCLSLFLGGCGTKSYDLSRAKIHLDLDQPGVVLIAVQDKRPYVISGEKPSKYLGRHINGTGLVRDVFTRNGQPASKELGKIIALALGQQGFKTRIIQIPPKEPLTPDNTKIASFAYDRLLCLAVDQFRIESFSEVEFQWDFKLDIFDFNNNLLATVHQDELKDGLVQNKFGAISSGQAQKVMVQEVAQILYVMLSSESIHQALSIEEHNGAIAETTDSAVQIDAMNEDQILINSLVEAAENDNMTEFRLTAIQICRKKVNDVKQLDQLAEVIWQLKDSDNPAAVDGVCYLCKTFRYGKNPRYRQFFTNLATNGKQRKVRKHARSVLRYFAPDGVKQFVPKEVTSKKTA